GAPRTAAEYWLRAGESAQARSTFRDAIAHIEHGLHALGSIERETADDLLEFRLQTSLARACTAADGWAGRRVRAAYSRARTLARTLGKTERTCEILWGLCAALCVQGAFGEATALAREYVAYAEQTHDRPALLMADAVALMAHFCQGQYDLAETHAARIAAHYRDEDRDLVRIYGQDPLVVACIYRSVWLWVQGRPDTGASVSARGVARARALNQPFTLCYALLNGACVTLLRREHVQALTSIDEAMAIAEELRFRTYKVYGPLLGAPALFEREPSASSIAWFEKCHALFRGAEAEMHRPLYLANLAAAYATLGQLVEAQARIVEALEQMDRTGERWIAPELLRVQAEVELAVDADSDRPELLLWHALDNARSAGARSFELRIACDLGVLLEKRGRRHDVEELIASLLEGFDEGADTIDHARARAWLTRTAWPAK
ncbi:MAG: hypothetical protein ABW321_30600, partial [Polyangiales bacterium]